MAHNNTIVPGFDYNSPFVDLIQGVLSRSGLRALVKLWDRGVPPGITAIYANGSPIVNGWLYCNGAAVSRVTYRSLFLAIGTTWGVGDGSTTFNLPNFVADQIEGAGWVIKT